MGKYPTHNDSLSSVTTKHSIVLDSVLRVMRPLVRLLLRQGITYPAFAAALKRVFLDAAQDELDRQGMARTDSALTLLCGVHRRDLRQLRLTDEQPALAEAGPAVPPSVAGEVAARWMSHRDWLVRGRPRALPRSGDGSFDALVASVSQDVRPRAMLDELLRLGVVREGESGIRLVEDSFIPRQGFAEMSALMADNLRDHAAAAAANLQDERNCLEQSIYVDQITAQSAQALQQVAVKAWAQAFKTVMREAQARFDLDAAQAPIEARIHRARVGVYFYSEPTTKESPP